MIAVLSPRLVATRVPEKYRSLGMTYTELYHRAKGIISQQWLEQAIACLYHKCVKATESEAAELRKPFIAVLKVAHNLQVSKISQSFRA